MVTIQQVRTKFIAKISNFGKDKQGNPRFIIILPNSQSTEAKRMKGKYLTVTLEETLENENNNDKRVLKK